MAGGCGKCLASFACLLQTGVAAAIIVLVAWRLNRVDVNVDPKALTASTNQVCYLGTSNTGYNLCYAAYAISGLSLLSTAALGILLCCTCNLCGLGSVLETIFAAVGAAAWAFAGVTLLQSKDRNAALPFEQYRAAVFFLTWTACALFAIMLLGNLYNLLASCLCCSCCGGRSRRGAKARSSAYDMEAATAKPVVVHHIHQPQQQFVYGDTSGYYRR